MSATTPSAPVLATRQPPGTQLHTIAVRSRLCSLLQDRLSFEVVAFLQAGLLAFNPVSDFLNHGLKFVAVPYEEFVLKAAVPAEEQIRGWMALLARKPLAGGSMSR